MYNLFLCRNRPINQKERNGQKLTGFLPVLQQARGGQLSVVVVVLGEQNFRPKLVFPKQKRLSRAAFPHFLKDGRRLSSLNFSIIIPKKAEIPTKEQGYAVVVSKKVARLSVTRHRIKRQVLTALRTLPLPQTVILFPKASVAKMSYQDILAELTDLFSKNHQ